MMSPIGFISDVDCYLFGHGTHYSIYEKLGAHPTTIDSKEGVYFAVWAPNASAVSVVGDFNNWDNYATPMSRISDSGIWEVFCEGLGVGTLYKFAVTTPWGEIRSAGPNINPIAVKYGGGGHAKASGATVANREIAMQMLQDLDALTGENQ